ncbi:tetratricopeptide repeat protein [Pseudodesulfovibrio sp. F-1]|uniref:Tetratricopeptide repeat protein n=1 Tax=Pseudodesulfovibrio alkaliphilus TaxID=2661613 RepID=A0A7K1KNB6_9BACT|nr:tetratricopeptide repeat protein [Pseudodesulfovibrio alkaliphilus]MUM77575.1 tetratricopeptide repeat protein [Pseudodesulfovibrio alkaliphilus]
MQRILMLILLATAMIFAVACSQERSAGDEDIRRARESYSKGFFLEAEKDYERYLQAEPQGEFRREAWDRLSEIAVTIKGDMDRAVVLLEAMYLELGMDQGAAWQIMFQLGDVYAQLGNQSKAIEALEKCLAHAEGSPRRTFATLLRMARLHRAMGNYDLVAMTLENCADSATDGHGKARCLYELAQSYSFIGNSSQARRALKDLLALPDADEETRVLGVFLLADIHESERDYAKARELLRSIQATYPNPKVVDARLANMPGGSGRPLPALDPDPSDGPDHDDSDDSFVPPPDER